MTERSYEWDGILVGDASLAPYSAAKWAYQRLLDHGQGASFPNYGILSGTGDGTYSPLRVQAKSPASANVELEVGAAMVNGWLYENTAALTFTVGGNSSGNPRIDTLILRADFVAQTIRAVIKQGTPAASPARPTLQQNTSLWETPLADIAVANGFSVINQTDITNRQRAVESLAAGWQHIANPLTYVPGNSYSSTTVNITAAGQLIAIPFPLVGNMSLADVQLRHIGAAFSYTINWGIYFQDANDGNASENTLRLEASGAASGSVAGDANILIPATPAPQPLTPGLHWLVMMLPVYTAAGLHIGAVSASAFDQVGYRLSASTLSALPQTLNMVTGAGGWTSGAEAVAVRLRGRVFGMTTPPLIGCESSRVNTWQNQVVRGREHHPAMQGLTALCNGSYYIGTSLA